MSNLYGNHDISGGHDCTLTDLAVPDVLSRRAAPGGKLAEFTPERFRFRRTRWLINKGTSFARLGRAGAWAISSRSPEPFFAADRSAGLYMTRLRLRWAVAAARS